MIRALLAPFALLLAMGAQPSTAADAEPPNVPRFVEETDTAGLQSRFEGEDEYMVGGGVAVFDCDADGLPDLYVTAGVNRSTLYRNRSARGATIKLAEERSGLESTAAIGAYPLDIDADGHLDVVVLRVGEVQVFRGLGQCKFERANERWHLRTGNDWHTAFAATWERGANWPTLAIGTYTDRARPEFPWGSCTPALLVRPAPAGAGFGEPQPLLPGHCALSMQFSDWNRSGIPSLRVSNDREYYKGGQEQLWKVQPGQPPALYTPADGWKPLQIWGMGIASSDIDGDGFPEYFLTSMSDNKLQKLQGDGSQPSYGDIAYRLGVTAHRPYAGGDVHPSTAWHAQFADVNNDGRVDLYVVKGNVSSMPDFATLDPNNLLLQQADGRFWEAGQASGVASFKRGRGGMLVDLNADGLLDMLAINRSDKAQLWRNTGSGSAAKAVPMGHWLQLRLTQAGPNRDAVGAWVEVDLGERIVRQELSVGGGHASGHMGWMHFGLGTIDHARVRVMWPHGTPSEWFELRADGFYVIDAQHGATPWDAK